MARNQKGLSPKQESPNKISLCLAEFVGTALLLFLGCMGCMVETAGMPVVHHFPAITFGLTVLLIIQIFGHISGAHLNPAVTLAAVILRTLDYITAAYYVFGQFCGAILGFGLLKLLTPPEYTQTVFFNTVTNTTEHKTGLCSTIPNPKLSLIQAVSLEAVITAILILVCCGVWDKRNEHKHDSIPVRFGLVIACIAMATGPFTGASMNTARTFAPALFNGDWKANWVYWIGPNLGALVGAYFYKYLYWIPNEDVDLLNEDGTEMDDMPLKSGDIVNKA